MTHVDARARLLRSDRVAATAEDADAAAEAEQAGITEDMEALAARLKASSLDLHDRLRRDNTVLDTTATAVESNIAAIAGVQGKLDEEVSSSMASFCEVLALLAVGVLLFVAAYVVMRLLPRPPW